MKVTLLMLLAIFLSSLMLTRVMVSRASALGMLDIPNRRSSHSVPTPRGGGIAIVVASILGGVAAWTTGSVQSWWLFALVVGGSVVAAVGWIDDRTGLGPGVRLLAHFFAVSVAFSSLAVSYPVWSMGLVVTIAASAVGIVAGVWLLNLCNFMDGIDGIAASQAIFVALACALLVYLEGGGIAVGALIVAAATAGFLRYNWPPAQIFMGDVGSGFLGFMTGLALLDAWSRGVSLWALALLPATFVADATVTLLVRASKRRRLHEAHRTHLYQHLALRWGRHVTVTLVYCAANLLVVLPAATLVTVEPALGAIVVIAVYTLLMLVAKVSGAGHEYA